MERRAGLSQPKNKNPDAITRIGVLDIWRKHMGIETHNMLITICIYT